MFDGMAGTLFFAFGSELGVSFLCACCNSILVASFRYGSQVRAGVVVRLYTAPPAILLSNGLISRSLLPALPAF